MLVVDLDSHPCADERPAVLARRPDLELPSGLSNRASEVRAGRGAFGSNAIVDAVIGEGFAGDEPVSVWRTGGKVTAKLRIGRSPRPFCGVENVTIGRTSDL